MPSTSSSKRVRIFRRRLLTVNFRIDDGCGASSDPKCRRFCTVQRWMACGAALLLGSFVVVGWGWVGRELADDVRLCQQIERERRELPKDTLSSHLPDCSQIARSFVRALFVTSAGLDPNPRAAIRRGHLRRSARLDPLTGDWIKTFCSCGTADRGRGDLGPRGARFGFFPGSGRCSTGQCVASLHGPSMSPSRTSGAIRFWCDR